LLIVLYRGWKKGIVQGFLRSIRLSSIFLWLLVSITLVFLDSYFTFSRAQGGLRYISKFGNIVGDADIVLPILISIVLLFIFFRSESREELFIELVCVITLTTLLGDVFKVLVGRARPYMGMGVFSFFNLSHSLFSNDFQSFPSGHVLFFSSLCTWFAFRLGWWFRFILPLLPIVVAYNRLESNNHYFSDVFFSWVLGYVIIARYMKEVRGTEEGPLASSACVILSFIRRLLP